MTTALQSPRCDYCTQSAKFTHRTRTHGQQRDACQTHTHMLVSLLGRIGGEITTLLGQQAQATDLLYPPR